MTTALKRITTGTLTLLFLVSTAISQEAIKLQIPTDSSATPPPVLPPPPPPPKADTASGGIKFTIPTDPSGTPIPAAQPKKPDTVQKLGLASNMPLNLTLLSAKDTASFNTYSQRLAIVQDSISAEYRAIESAKNKTKTTMPELAPKGEFEKQTEYDARSEKWHKELFDRTERDTKSHTTRLAELERAKKKIEENQMALYSSVNIKSKPEAASIYIGKEEIGSTPADYSLLIPGTVKISIRKEGYNSWDTTFQATPGAKFKIYAALEEKSIFSTEGEIDFVKFLSKDATIQGYEARIESIEARKVQVDEEIKKILEDFANSYPALEPQKPDETPDAFNKRHESWSKEGMRQVAEFHRKHEAYKHKLERSIAVLRDYIIATQSTIINEPSFSTKIELGAYDADKEQFELVAQDTASEKSPFLFKGKVGVPRDTAKNITNRSAPGFAAILQFVNYPFKTDSVNNANLAMSKLLLSKSGLDLKVEGSFSEIERYKSIEGYDAWKFRADSLLSGSLKPQGLDYAYAMGKAAAKDAVAKDESSSEGLGWRTWTRIATFTAAAVFTGLAVSKHLEAQDNVDKVNDLAKNVPPVGDPNRAAWARDYDKNAKAVTDSESSRNIFGGIAGAFAIGGAVTFFIK